MQKNLKSANEIKRAGKKFDLVIEQSEVPCGMEKISVHIYLDIALFPYFCC